MVVVVVPLLLSSKSSVFQVESQTQIGPPPNYLENDFETTLTERTGANFNNHVLRMITEGQSQHSLSGSSTTFGDSGRTWLFLIIEL